MLVRAVALLALLGVAFSAHAADISTNVCNMNWYYCPRDPGCTTYRMSVKEVLVHADNYAAPVPAENLTVGNTITIEVKGLTVLKTIPTAGSFRIYDLAGHNMYAGVLSDVMTLTGKDFTLNITFSLDAGAFAAGNWLEWGLDVFQDASGSNEAMCIEFADNEYLAYEKRTLNPPFVDYCVDDGDGTFTPKTIPITGHPIASPSCNNGHTCDLNWYYCPRDPGCVTYTMSVGSVEVDVQDPLAIRAGDTAKLTVHGTTSMTTVPVAGSFRIYALAGGNAFAGVLVDVMTISNCGVLGCQFVIVVPSLPVTQAMFTSQGWFEFGLDVFLEKSGTHEGMCIEIANDVYVTFEETTPQPTPGFVQLCQDNGWGHFANHTMPEVVSKAVCVLE